MRLSQERCFKEGVKIKGMKGGKESHPRELNARIDWGLRIEEGRLNS